MPGDDLRLAHDLADLADSLSLPRFRAADLLVETKPDLTPVTEADRAVELAIRDRLGSARPGDAVVGEEFGEDEGRAGGARWIVDPIDGTKNFVRGVPVWATLIALEREGELRAGVVSAPALGQRWWAARGTGAFSGDRRLHVSAIARLEDAQICHGGFRTWREAGMLDGFMELAERAWRTRGFGDFWMHMLVAEGSAEAAAELGVSIWDLAAAKLIVEEAGGRFTDLEGLDRADGGSALSSNGLLHDEVLATLRGRGVGVR